MHYNDLVDIIKTGEGYTIEFKKSMNSSIGKDICAFANSSGGKIIIGVEDKTNEVIGYKLTNSDKSKIQDIARNMNPSFNVQVEQIKDLVIVYIPEGKNKPYTINGHFYLRYGANSQQLNRDEIRELFQKENLISFERQTNLNFEEKDFSNEAFNNFRKNSNLDKTLSKQHILNNLNLLTNNKLSNAGILFFSNNIKYYYPTAIISCFLYSDKEQTEIIDSKEFTENFMSNLDNAYKYLISKLNTAIIIKDELRHKTKLELPKEALRETIINAMIHKDYNINSTVQINISPDKVEIINPGKLLFPREELGKRSILRNPILVDLIYRLELVEKAGSGIKRIQRLSKQDSIRVEFKTRMFFEVIFYRKIRSKSDANPTQIRHKSDRNKRMQWILEYLKNNKTITNKTIREHFNIHKDTVAGDLKNLIKKGKIIRKGSGNNVWYELKSKK
jgi:ATP-dependent DNA helicase RecG